MPFSVSTIQGEHCDKCKSKDGDLLCVSYTNRRENAHAVIFVHERCLQKAIDKAKKPVENTEKAG